jgi:hypothetical protein
VRPTRREGVAIESSVELFKWSGVAEPFGTPVDKLS